MEITANTTRSSTTNSERQALLDQLNGATGNNGTGSATGNQGAGKAQDQTDRFLKLLVAQMSHQDPLNPLDNAQVTSQMAQISTVEGISKMNTSLGAMADQAGGVRAIDAAGLIGKSALIEGSQLSLRNGIANAAIQLPQGAGKAQVQVLDAAGTVLRSIELNNLEKGVTPFAWDGKDNAGNTLAEGNYSMRALANPGPNQVAAATLSAVRINAVVGDQASLRLELSGLGLVSQGQIKGYL